MFYIIRYQQTYIEQQIHILEYIGLLDLSVAIVLYFHLKDGVDFEYLIFFEQ